jgi:hypothetical protein
MQAVPEGPMRCHARASRRSCSEMPIRMRKFKFLPLLKVP